jgi:SAM-dependent methyltransferase
MQVSEKLSTVLRLPGVYSLFQRMFRGGDHWSRYLNEYPQPAVGEKILDIGCGPAEILDYLPNVHYTGFDINPEYIDAAKKNLGNRGRFWCADIGLANLEHERGTFDLVLATGVLHHLDDLQAASLFALARLALRPGGRLTTLDGCYMSGQSKLARWLLDRDRGKYVRSQPQYERLAAGAFSKVESYVRGDFFRAPYTVLIMRCRN